MDEGNLPELSAGRNFTPVEHEYFRVLSKHFDESPGTSLEKLGTFARFVPRQTLASFLARSQIFQHILSVHGHIIECGVFRGAGLFSWANLSSIYEPYNHTRRIVGFDTFEGFPELRIEDQSDHQLDYKRVGGLASENLSSIQASIDIFDLNRFLSQIPRIELVAGDACRTIPRFCELNRHLIVALLYLDFDLYEPTRVAIESFWPLMPRGSVIAFDELNQSHWPGETQALVDSLGIGSLRLERLPIHPQMSYAIKQ